MKIKLCGVILLLTMIACSCNEQSAKKPIIIDKRAVTLTTRAAAIRLNYSHNNDSLKQAIKLLDSSIKIDKRYETTYACKVFILCQLNNYQQAIVVLNQAVALSPYNVRLVTLQGMLFEKTGAINQAMLKYKRADGIYDLLIQAKPNNVNYKLSKAFLQLLLNKKDEALREYNAIAKNSKDENVIAMKPFFYVFDRDAYIKTIFQNVY
jgi:tetratricopeptide (TPR) repeat protein